MTVILVFVVLTAALGLASALGWTHDSRDPEYSLGRVPHPYPRAGATERPSANPPASPDSS